MREKRTRYRKVKIEEKEPEVFGEEQVEEETEEPEIF